MLEQTLDRLRNEGRELRKQLKASVQQQRQPRQLRLSSERTPAERHCHPQNRNGLSSAMRQHRLPRGKPGHQQGGLSSRASEISTATPSSQASSGRSMRQLPSTDKAGSPAQSREGSARCGVSSLHALSGIEFPDDWNAAQPRSPQQRVSTCKSSVPQQPLHVLSPSPEAWECLLTLREAVRHGDVEVARNTIEAAGSIPRPHDSMRLATHVIGLSDDHGWTPLHYAAALGHVDVCEMLLLARADVNATLLDYSTPLMLAAEEGKMRTARLLLSYGAKTHHKDEAGFTVLDRCAPGLAGLMALAISEEHNPPKS
mmetsp:Transcript_29021/g.52864  ORF Transcript_29021/g.52864 Transcript_29021/m.52864 type:complete len:314 (-) Transcript_29021:45-986(-)